ncbi:serine hydrolase domain-containing protein [Nocardioides sp. NPDC126508]
MGEESARSFQSAQGRRAGFDPPRVHGFNIDALDGLNAAIAANLSTGDEVGLSVHVRQHGRVLADLWGGRVAPGAAATAWGEDTVVNLWSLTKIVATLAILHAVERGVLELDLPVAAYWPEYGVQGKDAVTLAHLLSHTSGTAGWTTPFTVSDLYDHAAAASRLAAQSPRWVPGTRSGYAAACFGTPLSEVLRRTTGMSLREYVEHEVTPPLGADLQVGLLPRDYPRAADLIPPVTPPPMGAPLPPLFREIFRAPAITPADAGRADWRAADIGAANGHGNARSVAMIGEAFLNDTLIGSELRNQVFTPRSEGPDLVLGMNLNWGLGFALATGPTFSRLPDTAAVWGGWGGSLLVIDPSTDLVIAYVMNKMSPDLLGSSRAYEYVELTYSALTTSTPERPDMEEES